MNVRINITPLQILQQRLQEVTRGFGGKWGVQLDLGGARTPYPTLRPRKKPAGAQPTNAQVALYLQAQKADFFAVTPMLRNRIMRELTARFAGRSLQEMPTAAQLMFAIGPMYRKAVYERLTHEGQPDTPAEANTLAWTRRKARLGLSTKKLQASGQLAKAMKSATIRVVRMG